MGVTPSPPDALPVSGVMPRTTALQILSCGCYEHQRTRFRSREWMQAHRLPTVLASGYAELGPATGETRAAAKQTYPVSSVWSTYEALIQEIHFC